MAKKYNLAILIKKITKEEMPERCQKLLPKISRGYFNRMPIEELEYRLNQEDKKFVPIVYKKLEQIKTNCLKRITPYLAKHPNDVKEDYLFADAIIKYCAPYHKLKKELWNVFNEVHKNKGKMKLRGLRYDRKALEILAVDPALYIFIIDKLLEK